MPARRLFGPAALTNAAATKYTVPAGLRGIIRHVRITNPSGAPVNVTVSVGADAAGVRLLDAVPFAAGAEKDYYWYLTLAAAEIIQAFASTTGVVIMTINGEEEAA